MNVLVTGIDGFVGTHLRASLAGIIDVRLFGIVRHRTPTQSLTNRTLDFTPLTADIRDAQQVQMAIDECKPDKIFHLAGQAYVPVSFKDPIGTFQTNIQGTLNLLEAVRRFSMSDKKRCSVLVVSSAEVYGSVPAELLPIDEHVPLNPPNPYAVSKACVDLIAQQYRINFDIDVVVARPFNHLGPGQSDLFVGSSFAKQIAEIKLGKRDGRLSVGNLDPVRDFTDVRDVVQAYQKLLDRTQEHAVFNICSERFMSIKALLELLRELSGVDVEIVPDPTRQRTREIPTLVGCSARLRSATGWFPTIPLEQTLRDLLAYWENHLRHVS